MSWKVLVVDDDADTCANLSDILTDFGHNVATAANGFDALSLANEQEFDLVLFDLKMPGLDGLEFYQELKRVTPTAVAVLITGFADSRTEQRAVDSGVWRVLSKPVEISVLMQLVEQAERQPVMLLVDDDADFCASLRDVLSHRECRVAVAHSCQEALSQFEAHNFHSVIADWRLPDCDGLALLQQLRSAHRDVQTVLITGHNVELQAAQRASSEVPADVLFYKPLDIDNLLNVICRPNG